MEWKPPADLVCHPAKAQLEAMLRSNKIGRKLAEGFEHMEQKRMKSEDALAAARQTVEKATSEATEQLAQARAVEAQVMDLLNEAEKKVVATKAHCDECLVVAGAASSNSAPPPPDPKFLPGQSVCHWWASWFQGCTAEKAPGFLPRWCRWAGSRPSGTLARCTRATCTKCTDGTERGNWSLSRSWPTTKASSIALGGCWPRAKPRSTGITVMRQT